MRKKFEVKPKRKWSQKVLFVRVSVECTMYSDIQRPLLLFQFRQLFRHLHFADGIRANLWYAAFTSAPPSTIYWILYSSAKLQLWNFTPTKLQFISSSIHEWICQWPYGCCKIVTTQWHFCHILPEHHRVLLHNWHGVAWRGLPQTKPLLSAGTRGHGYR